MSTDLPFQRALSGAGDDDAEEDTNAEATTDAERVDRSSGGGLSARKQTVGGEDVPLAEPVSQITFEDSGGFLSGSHGRPRPRKFWTAKQLGRTPPMQIIKDVSSQQLTGGSVRVEGEDELTPALAELADLVEDVLEGPHHRGLKMDALIDGAVSELLDTAWAYWEELPSEDGAFPVAGFKPIPSLQIQHNIDKETGAYKDPAFYHVPYSASGGTVTIGSAEPKPINRDQMVVMTAPQSTEYGLLYGESLATKVRQYLELIIDIDVHQKRNFSDSELASGFVHFQGSANDDELTKAEEDLKAASGDPNELVTTSSDGAANWVQVGSGVVNMDAIQAQQWYFKLVLAAAGLNANEIGVIEGSGFAKETPALQRAVFKKVTKPLMGAIFDPINEDTYPRMLNGFDAVPDGARDLTAGLERFDPVQEQIEKEETLNEWGQGIRSLNEVRAQVGAEAVDVEIDPAALPIELPEGMTIADVPRALLDMWQSVDDATADATGEPDAGESVTESGPPDFESDPVVSVREAFDVLGESYAPRVIRQLEDTIDIQSSFIVSAAYDATANFMQIEFESPGGTATYWYGGVERFRFFNFLQASSKGEYFNKYIRHTGENNYPYVRLD